MHHACADTAAFCARSCGAARRAESAPVPRKFPCFRHRYRPRRLRAIRSPLHSHAGAPTPPFVGQPVDPPLRSRFGPCWPARQSLATHAPRYSGATHRSAAADGAHAHRRCSDAQRGARADVARRAGARCVCAALLCPRAHAPPAAERFCASQRNAGSGRLVRVPAFPPTGAMSRVLRAANLARCRRAVCRALVAVLSAPAAGALAQSNRANARARFRHSQRCTRSPQLPVDLLLTADAEAIWKAIK